MIWKVMGGVILALSVALYFVWNENRTLANNNATLKVNVENARSAAKKWRNQLFDERRRADIVEDVLRTRNVQARQLQEEAAAWQRRYKEAKKHDQALRDWGNMPLPEYIKQRVLHHAGAGTDRGAGRDGVPANPGSAAGAHRDPASADP